MNDKNKEKDNIEKSTNKTTVLVTLIILIILSLGIVWMLFNQLS